MWHPVARGVTWGLSLATPISSSSSYASATDLVNAHDVRKICEYASDTGVPITPGEIATNAKVVAALLRASGEVESWCYRGEKYTPTDLADLTGASEAALKGLVADRAFYHLAKRRIPKATEIAGYKESQEVLEALGAGEMIFGIQEVARAAHMSTADISTDSAGRVNRMTDVARRFFGRRADDFGSNPITGYY